MLAYIEYLGVPTTVGIVIIALFAVSQVIGEVIELCGKVSPELMKVRKIFKRRREEREKMQEAFVVLDEAKATIREFNAHYSVDNIMQRDKWMHDVDSGYARHEAALADLTTMLKKNNSETTEMLIENMRDRIINFAATVADPNAITTHEQFRRIMKTYKRYEAILAENGLENGEVDIAYRIITEALETRLKTGNFLENQRGYDKP